MRRAHEARMHPRALFHFVHENRVERRVELFHRQEFRGVRSPKRRICSLPLSSSHEKMVTCRSFVKDDVSGIEPASAALPTT